VFSLLLEEDKMKKIFVTTILLILCVNLVLAVIPENNCNPGAIWTTRADCGAETQNVNKYAIGEKVYINGKNFVPGTYNWYIKGLPGGASCDPMIKVANSTYTVDASGNFCFEAYTVNTNDCGEYKVFFGGKYEGYRVDLDAPIVPEFGTVIAGLTILGALGIFFIIRRK
jgi:hypothetical protein